MNRNVGSGGRTLEYPQEKDAPPCGLKWYRGPDLLIYYFAPVVASALNSEGIPIRLCPLLGFAPTATRLSSHPAAKQWLLRRRFPLKVCLM